MNAPELPLDSPLALHTGFRMQYEPAQESHVLLFPEGMITLSGSATDEVPATLVYEWDLDGDGVFGETGAAAERGDEVGQTPTFSAAGCTG